MKILHVTLGFYPAIAWGGPIKIVYQNCRELVRRGHQVTVYCTNLLDKKNKIQKGTFEGEMDGIRIVYFDTWNISSWPGTLGPIWLPDLSGHLKREITGFDIIHLNGYRSPVMLMVAKYARKAGVPIVSQPMGSLPIINNSFLVKRLYDRMVGSLELKGISTLIALQEMERQHALAHGIPEDRVEIIPNGIDTMEKIDAFQPGYFRRRFGFDHKRPLILFLARVNKIKGTDMLVEAFALLENLDAHLAIVGPDDGQLSEVINLVDKYHLRDRVTITGAIPESEKIAAFRDADLFVLPSRYDAFPTTVMEACLHGKPMVITDRCESARLLKNRVAEVVPFECVAFASAIRKVLTDNELYERYKKNCQAVVEDTFSIKNVVDRIESVYERAINKKG